MDQMRDLEKETLQVISQINEFAKFTDLYELARNYRRLQPRGPINLHFKIEMDIRTRAEVKKTLVPRHIYMGVTAAPIQGSTKLSNSSYSLAICKSIREPSTILRKLHFDFEDVSLRSNEPKPSSHMQIGGKLNPHMRNMGYNDSHVVHFKPAFEKPRIPCMPVCLALLLHWVFLEFDCDKTAKKIITNDTWRKHVAKAERIILKPYFESATKFLSDTKTIERSFIAESLYALQS